MSARTTRRSSLPLILRPASPLEIGRRIAARHVALAAAAGLGFAGAPAMAATFTVNATGDGGDTVCDATCTLRDAILTANGTLATDTIKFSATIFPATTQTE
ncbi:MAG: CSLREA domain-containing protein, partial [Nevskiales bacterium]